MVVMSQSPVQSCLCNSGISTGQAPSLSIQSDAFQGWPVTKALGLRRVTDLLIGLFPSFVAKEHISISEARTVEASDKQRRTST
jgi:hypothetical protein